MKQKIKNAMHQWFMYLFEQRMDSNRSVHCFECNKLMHEDYYKDLSICYSHILSKKTYPQYKGKEWNIEITCPDCHHLYTVLPSKATNQYAKYLELLEKHKNNALE